MPDMAVPFTVDVWQDGTPGNNFNQMVVVPQPSCAPTVDTAVHSSGETASLHFATLSTFNTGSCYFFEFVFTEPLDMSDYKLGHLLFNLRSGSDLNVSIIDTRSFNVANNLGSLGFVPNNAQFQPVVVPIRNLMSTNGSGSTDWTSVIKIRFDGKDGASEVWMDNVRWTPN
jgi:hypothetical protein